MTLDNSPEDFVFNANHGDVAAVAAVAAVALPDSSRRLASESDSQRSAHSPLIYGDLTGPHGHGLAEEWCAEISHYGLTAATPVRRSSIVGDRSARLSAVVATKSTPIATTASATATAAPQLQTTVVATNANANGKRQSGEDSHASSSSRTTTLPPLKKARTTRFAAPRNIDLSVFSKATVPAKGEGVTSPLFFSHRQKPALARPPSYSGSEALGTMLRSVREGTDVTTLKLARGTVNAASPARSSSTPGSWSSIEGNVTFNRSPDNQAASPGFQFLQGVGILELLERDDRPTFVIDATYGANVTAGAPFSILYFNPALQVSEAIRLLISGEFQDESEAKSEFVNFKAWVVKNPDSLQDNIGVFLPSYHYGGLDWTCSIIRSRFRFVSANRSAASIAQSIAHTSPEPQLEREASVESRARGNTPIVQPQTPSDVGVPDAPDYFGDVRAVEVDEAPHSLGGSDTDEFMMHRDSAFPTDLILSPALQPSFDWTRIPLRPDLPPHILFARSRDWASTPLGPIEDWGADLRGMANMVMGSPHPAAMYWGPELIAIYNEAYIPMAGQKHPKLMGQRYKEAWEEIWPELASVFDSAWQSGQATMKNDDRLLVNRHGFEEETFFSWSIVPLVGDDGSVVGLYNPAFENTRRKVAERRMLTLRELGEKTALARDVKSFWSQVQQGLEYNEEDVPFVMVYSVTEDSESDMSSMHSGSLSHPPQLVLEASLGIPEGHRCLVSPLDLKTSTEGFAPYMRDSMAQAGVPIILSKDDGSLAEDLMDGFEFRGEGNHCKSIVIFPVHPTTGGESVVGFLIIGLNPRRPYDEDYQLFIHLLSRQLATSMASVVLFEEEIRRGQRAARLAALDRQELTEQLHLRTQEVQESELKFTRMATFAPVGIFIANGQGLINYCNDMWWEISQHPQSDPVNSWMNSVRDDDRPALEEAWHKLIKDKSAITKEFRFKCSREDGGSIIDNWVLMSAYPEKDGDGGIKSIFGCITNISQQKLAEQIQKQRREEAIELKRQQENFIDITSHEMRNPLSAILQCADEISGTLAKHRFVEDRSLKQTMEACLEAANTIALCASHQKRIVDDILTLSKLDSQLLLVTPVDVQPVAVVQRVLKMFEGELNANTIQMKFSLKNRYLDMGVDWVKLDPSRLLQVLINLMTNAIKFTQSRPQRVITITLDASTDISERTDSDISYFPSHRADKRSLTDELDWGTGEKLNLHFSVQDTGRGLDEHEKKLLFQRFSQATPRTHVQYGGSGLGLFISRILTELQGGQIGVDSQKGVGSNFSFYIQSRKSAGPPDKKAIATAPPLTRAPGSSTTVANKRPKGIANGIAKSPRSPLMPKPSAPPGTRVFDILIVEDNIVNQKVLQRQLTNCGNRTQVANHGGEALDVLKTSRFWSGNEATGCHISVILMDLEMPIMDGMTCARKIRELERDGIMVSHIPIMAVTAYARPEQIEDAKGAGIDDVISKPFRMPELIPRIEELVDKWAQTQSNTHASAGSSLPA